MSSDIHGIDTNLDDVHWMHHRAHRGGDAKGSLSRFPGNFASKFLHSYAIRSSVEQQLIFSDVRAYLNPFINFVAQNGFSNPHDLPGRDVTQVRCAGLRNR